MSELVFSIFPFALGLVLLLAQPIVDLICERALERNRYDNRAFEAARWTGSTSAFLPSAILSIYGALVVVLDEGHEDGEWILITTMFVLTVSFLLFLYALAVGGPAQDRRFGIKKAKYTLLQLVLCGLNVAGIVLAVVYYVQDTPTPLKPGGQ